LARLNGMTLLTSLSVTAEALWLSAAKPMQIAIDNLLFISPVSRHSRKVLSNQCARY